LRVAKFAKESGPYGEAPHHDVMIMFGNFPEKGGSMEASKVRKPLKK
jgi:hypothetical protein